MTNLTGLCDLAGSGHICWIAQSEASYVAGAQMLLATAKARGDKAVLFGPKGSSSLAHLGALADVAVDPGLELKQMELMPETMFDMFGEELAAACRSGHTGLYVVADMDWLLALAPAMEEVIAFELLLDRRLKQLGPGATIVCAYRTGSFDTAAIIAVRCVHMLEAAPATALPFRFVSADESTWRLAGDIDIAVLGPFRAALQAAVLSAGPSPCVIDVSDLQFIDASGLRVLAEVAIGISVELRGARPIVRRSWAVGQFATQAPSVSLVS